MRKVPNSFQDPLLWTITVDELLVRKSEATLCNTKYVY